jgi:hypothetical protein
VTGEIEVIGDKPGKPRTRWEDIVSRDTSKILGVKRMKETSRRQ